MGDISDMTINGILCEGCGEYLGNDVGYPRLCRGCAKDRRSMGHVLVKGEGGFYVDSGPVQKALVTKVACDVCGKKVKVNGLADHKRRVHS